MISVTKSRCIRSSNSGSASSEGGRGVDVPVLKGVEVPDGVGVGNSMGSLGTIIVILNITSPDSEATGFAEYFALSISIVLYLQLATLNTAGLLLS